MRCASSQPFGLSNLKDRIMEKAQEKQFQLTLLYKGVDECDVCVLLAVMDDGLTSLTFSFIYRVAIVP
jgi:hypothetical protein